MKKKKFNASLSELGTILSWIRQTLCDLGVRSSDVRKMELALEEALVNIIHHGYRGACGSVQIQLSKSNDRMEAIIRDWSSPYNPLEAPQKNPIANLDFEKEGGWGIFLMRQLMDEIIYRRDNEANVLVLIKRFSHTR